MRNSRILVTIVNFKIERGMRNAVWGFGRQIASDNIFWYEEPVSPLDYEGHAQLRDALPMKIATGENLYTTHEFDPMFAAMGCDYAMPDILRCGGIQHGSRMKS